MNISSTSRVIIFVSVASVLVVNASPSPDMMRDANFRFGKFSPHSGKIEMGNFAQFCAR